MKSHIFTLREIRTQVHIADVGSSSTGIRVRNDAVDMAFDEFHAGRMRSCVPVVLEQIAASGNSCTPRFVFFRLIINNDARVRYHF